MNMLAIRKIFPHMRCIMPMRHLQRTIAYWYSLHEVLHLLSSPEPARPDDVNLVIYHKDCFDGFGAAFSAWKLLGNHATYVTPKMPWMTCESYLPAEHNPQNAPCVDDQNVAICDYSYSLSITECLLTKGSYIRTHIYAAVYHDVQLDRSFCLIIMLARQQLWAICQICILI